MTCVVGLVHDGITYIGADAAGANDDVSMVGKTSKVFRKGPYVIGYCGSYRWGQAIKAIEKDIPWDDVVDWGDYMETVVAPWFSDNVFCEAKSIECVALIGVVGGHLFEMAGDYAIFEPTLPYITIGTGSAFAMGYLWGRGGSLANASWLAQQALSCAETFTSGCVKGPFTVLHTGDDT